MASQEVWWRGDKDTEACPVSGEANADADALRPNSGCWLGEKMMQKYGYWISVGKDVNLVACETWESRVRHATDICLDGDEVREIGRHYDSEWQEGA